MDVWYIFFMKILEVDKKLIKKFVDFPDELYADDPNYVPYMKGSLTKTLKKLVLQEKSYVALLAMEDKKVLARILFTVDRNKQLHTERCCFFSMFECVNDVSVCSALMDEVKRYAKRSGADYISGTYFPDDPDNRRGILYHGFQRAPLIFTSYNKPWYDALLTACGLRKQTDAYEYEIDLKSIDADRLNKVAEYSKRKYDYRVDTLNWNDLERDIADVHEVLQAATGEVNYQEAPSVAELQRIVVQWKQYLNKDFILIARKNADNAPIGFVMALPDFFQVFRKMHGKMDVKGMITFFFERKKICSYRAIMQYVVPEYQQNGTIVPLYSQILQSADKYGVDYMEAGTIMEKNVPSNMSMKTLKGKLARVYRIYFSEVEKC